jgi:GDPmannose 4,6-dehydratase
MYGETTEFLDELSPFNPVSPYAVSKLSCYQICQYYFRTYSLDVRQAIGFNHESPFRNELFVTRKITSHIAKHGDTRELQLGNVDAVRDWGHAKDFVKAYHLIMTKGKPGTAYVVATGESASVREFVQFCYAANGFKNLKWLADGLYS